MHINFTVDDDNYAQADHCTDEVCGDEGCGDPDHMLLYLPWVCLFFCGEGFLTEKEQNDHMWEKHGAFLDDKIRTQVM
jgi:hypothetical protein